MRRCLIIIDVWLRSCGECFSWGGVGYTTCPAYALHPAQVSDKVLRELAPGADHHLQHDAEEGLGDGVAGDWAGGAIQAPTCALCSK